MDLTPIGIFHCNKQNPASAARQGTLDISENLGVVELYGQNNFEQALIGLESFTHIWLLYEFNRNQDWKPMVQPPRGTNTKKGVFATRSPYRPNPIGMSAVELVKIEKRSIYVRKYDLLDQTPILDIKPYLAYADAFPEASLGWIETDQFEISFSERALEQIFWLKEHGLTELQNFIENQLSHDPFNRQKKRVRVGSETSVLAFRTWRIEFCQTTPGSLMVNEIFSGYSEMELSYNAELNNKSELSSEADPYHDKELHWNFCRSFQRTLK